MIGIYCQHSSHLDSLLCCISLRNLRISNSIMAISNIISYPPVGIFLGLFIIVSVFEKTKNYGRKKKGLFLKSRPENKCFKCQGFGISRCSLCFGKGFVLYERKFQRSDPCPKCFQKRYDMCSFCQGTGGRTFFGKY